MPHEQQPKQKIELAPELVHAYAQSFLPRFDRYPFQKPDGSYLAVQHPLHTTIVEAHLKGHITIGAYALDEKNKAKWLCFDADEDSQWQQLVEMAGNLAEQKIPSYLEPSRRGGHLWLFFTKPLSGKDARRFGKQLMRQYNLPPMELYPRQDELRTGAGSFVRLPLGIHQLKRHRYHFIHTDGTPLSPTIREQIQHLTNPYKVQVDFTKSILKDAPKAKVVFPTNPFKKGESKNVAGDTPSERIKNRISVFDFVSQYVDLDTGGRGYCPFHDDSRQSFGVNKDGNFWNCFAGCGAGSVIDFWMKWRKLNGKEDDFTATITELAKMLL